MRKQRKRRPSKAKSFQRRTPTGVQRARLWSRRDLLHNLAYGAIGLVIVGGGGYHFVSGVRASINEGDLSKLGNGIPTIVQIHDPGCPSCRSLQRTTREALEQLGEGVVQYLVANIKAPDGRKFADAHGAGHVTLLLFDGNGRRRHVLRGQQHKEHLLRVFRRLASTRGEEVQG